MGQGLASAVTLLILSTACQPSAETRSNAPSPWRAGPALPQPITNNAVAAIAIDGGALVFSFLGLDSTKVWSGVSNATYRWNTLDTGWTELEPVPGEGRLASTAQVVGGKIYVIGGYTVAENGTERSVPDVNVFDPATDSWSRAADIPVPSDDAVAGVWNDSLIVLVSGWHDTENIPNVQLFDPATDSWTQATPIPGPPVFGHTGAVVGDLIVYVDGTTIRSERPRFTIDASTWAGQMDPEHPSTIAWSGLLQHPGPPLYRSAAAVIDGQALFIGGTDNPYNYDGIGYDGVAAEPLPQILAYAPKSGLWRELPPLPVASMDHRNAGVTRDHLFVVGGMTTGQTVTDRVWVATHAALFGSSR